MTVIDASALAKYLLRERGWESVEPHLERGAYSLDLAIKEVANAIWKHAVARRRIGLETARKLYRALRLLVDEGVVVLEPEERYVDEAFEIALSTGLPVYDALYVAQARAKGGLVTADEGQARVARSLGVRVHVV